MVPSLKWSSGWSIFPLLRTLQVLSRNSNTFEPITGRLVFVGIIVNFFAFFDRSVFKWSPAKSRVSWCSLFRIVFQTNCKLSAWCSKTYQFTRIMFFLSGVALSTIAILHCKLGELGMIFVFSYMHNILGSSLVNAVRIVFTTAFNAM